MTCKLQEKLLVRCQMSHYWHMSASASYAQTLGLLIACITCTFNQGRAVYQACVYSKSMHMSTQNKTQQLFDSMFRFVLSSQVDSPTEAYYTADATAAQTSL